MKFKIYFGTLVVFFASLPGYSQEKSILSVRSEKVNSLPVVLMVDGTNVLLSGFGMKGTYRIHPKVAVGMVAGVSNFKPSETESKAVAGYDYNHKLTQVGVVADLALIEMTENSTIYATVGLSQADVKTSVNDTFFGSNSSEDARLGVISALGWQFKHPLAFTGDFGMILQLGLGYGNGNRINYRLSGTETKLGDGMTLDIKAGVIF